MNAIQEHTYQNTQDWLNPLLEVANQPFDCATTSSFLKIKLMCISSSFLKNEPCWFHNLAHSLEQY